LPSAPVAVTVTTGDSTRRADLGFDAQGEARWLLEPGVYRWQAAAVGAAGLAVVEPYSDEFVARARAVPAGTAWLAAGRRVGARDTWWIYALALGALVAEWALRMRRGLP
jgi:hypothetical protein